MSGDTIIRPDFSDKATGYKQLAVQLAALLTDEPDFIAKAANTAALLFNSLPDINWAGFYLWGPAKGPDPAGGELVLGPFQGKPACVRIALGRGVCGTAAEHRETVVVPDVHAFPGHIACDAASRSEIVVPLLKDGQLLGVLDIDSPLPGRFDDLDRSGLERAAAVFMESL